MSRDTSKRSLVTIMLTILLASATALAGCVQEGEEAGEDGDVEDGDADTAQARTWEEVITVPENSTALTVNITIESADENVTNATARLLAPNGSVVMSGELEWSQGELPESVNLSATAEDNATLETGEWGFEVWAPGHILVASDIVIKATHAPEAEG